LASVFQGVGCLGIVHDFGGSGGGNFGCEVGESDQDGGMGALFVWGVEQRGKLAYLNARRTIANFEESCIIGSQIRSSRFGTWDGIEDNSIGGR